MLMVSSKLIAQKQFAYTRVQLSSPHLSSTRAAAGCHNQPKWTIQSNRRQSKLCHTLVQVILQQNMRLERKLQTLNALKQHQHYTYKTSY